MKTETAILLAAALLSPQIAFAQEATETEAVEASGAEPQQQENRLGLETVVVTAQKRETSLQDTAVAISAFTGETLEDRGIDDLANLQCQQLLPL